MKRYAILLAALLLFFIPAAIFAAETLPVDADIQSGKVSVEDTKPSAEEAEAAEEAEELDTKGAEQPETSPALPDEASKSIYFGDVRFFAGYTTLNMADYNKFASNSNIQQIKSALLVGVDFGIKILQCLSAGPRVEFIKAFAEGTGTLNKIDVSLLPVMAGLTYSYYLTDLDFIISAGAYAGYAWANGTFEENVGGTANVPKRSEIYGSCFAADFDLRLDYMINTAISAGITAGYRIANLPTMKAKGTYIETDTVINASENDIAFDFSGLVIGAGVLMNY
ncbi:MAG: hypothetical protein CVV21_02760 [Candidatus Goldiibacteriota bacterium HGW-Goldbacteria-1]|jgi:hypothetical protein|nr:MAG: hypothetical protein CVV21_02760 [Candidatus Goldiibacteriota bacterium HGW-Goldbacteria-1]